MGSFVKVPPLQASLVSRILKATPTVEENRVMCIYIYIYILKPLSTGKVWINWLLASRISVESVQKRQYYASHQNNSKGGLPWFGGLRSLSYYGLWDFEHGWTWYILTRLDLECFHEQQTLHVCAAQTLMKFMSFVWSARSKKTNWDCDGSVKAEPS